MAPPPVQRVVWSTSQFALALGVPDWCIRRVVQRGLVPGKRLGSSCWLWWSEADVPAVWLALQAAGYAPAGRAAPQLLPLADPAGETVLRAAGRRPGAGKPHNGEGKP
jgi:hypothetical protein